MPSPIGHSLAGICGYLLARNTVFPLRRYCLFAGSIVIANLPDLDLVPVLLLGETASFHRQWTHSLVAALGFGLLVGGLAKWAAHSGVVYGIWGGGVYLSHIILDMLLDDPTIPRGVQLLWPYSDSYFILPFTPFASFSYGGPNLGIIAMFFEPHNIATMVKEAVLMVPWVCLAAYLGGRLWRKR